MAVCVFFGHRDAPSTLIPRLRAVIDALVQEGVDTFYVGNHGDFDRMVRAELVAIAAARPTVRYAVVLAYLPRDPLPYDTVYPEGVESVPPRFAIDARNRWMLTQADVVVTYVCRPFGGAAKYKRAAQHRGRRVIELDE